MMTISRGPNSLQVIEKELNGGSLDWATIQSQAKEYARMGETLSKTKVPMGSADSWSKLTAAFAESANDFDKAAQAKNKEDAVAAQFELKNSCMTCHNQHRPKRGGPPGGGGLRPPGRGF